MEVHDERQRQAGDAAMKPVVDLVNLARTLSPEDAERHLNAAVTAAESDPEKRWVIRAAVYKRAWRDASMEADRLRDKCAALEALLWKAVP